ncbi:hypothetical protein LSCM1_00185 [Leishmania martiniquensis]|uniref:Uncharacterized protein n=1 Tax=Leishmania martiniquensis TaxID=1580590 RepID=A0A836GS69_9TRYP|nr:hypothetical protein LSCM1_00185 [Leishmania martiniquensis]
MRRRDPSVIASPPLLSSAILSSTRAASSFTCVAPHSLGSRRPTKGQHEMQTADALQSPPRKRRGVAVAAPMARDNMTAAAVVSVPLTRSSSFRAPPSSHELQTKARLPPGTKRGRVVKGESWMVDNQQRGSCHCNEAAVDGTAAVPASSTSSASSGTSRTLTYDLASALLPSSPGRDTREVKVSPPSLVGSIATPARRDHLVLTSTPLFIREERERGPGGDAATHTPSAFLRTPMRLARAAQGFLSPASATLRRRLSHIRQSASETVGPRPGPELKQQPTSSSSSPPLLSPWGRLSSIVLDGESVPSFVEEGSGGTGCAPGAVGLRCKDFAPSSLSLRDAATRSSLLESRQSAASASDEWRRRGRGTELPGRPRTTIRPDSAVLDGVDNEDASASLSRRSSPPVTGVDEMWADSRLQRRLGAEEGLGGVGECGGRVALRGPYDVRFAQVSSLSESLAGIVSSSRSTAHSSLTSASTAAASSTVAPSRISSSGRGTAGDTEGECMPRRSAAVMDPNLSSILPDEEEQAIRRRLQRGHRPSAPRTQRNRDSHGANAATLEQAQQHPPRARAAAGNVMELFVARALPSSPLDRQLPLPKEVGRSASSRIASGAFALAGERMATSTSGPQGVNAHVHVTDAWPPRPFASSMSPSPTWRAVACASRLTVALLSALACVWCVVAVASPLVALQPRYALSTVARVDSAAAETQFAQTYASTVTDLQALYQIAPASLDADAVVRLHHRTLSEAVERLERATQHLVPDDNASPLRRLFYLRAMIRTYLTLSRSCELYARSRDGSLWRRFVGYPLADVKRYGVRRFGSFSSQPSVAPSAVAAWWDRVWTTAACSAQSEVLACPSVLYVEEVMARDAAQFVYTDSNEAHESPRRRRKLQDWRTRLRRDWTSEVYLETLLSYLRAGVQELTRDYNR